MDTLAILLFIRTIRLVIIELIVIDYKLQLPKLKIVII